FASARKLLDPAPGEADPNAVLLVDADADGPAQARLDCLKRSAEIAGLVAVVAPMVQVLAVGSELLHAADGGLGGVNVAGAVERDELRPADARGFGRIAAELARLHAVLAPFEKKLDRAVEHLHPAISLVGDVHPAVPTNGDAAGPTE